MKNLILIPVLALTLNTAFAQCEKNALLKFDEITEIRDGISSPIKVEGTFAFSKDKIVMKASRAGGEMIIESDIKSILTCKWNTYLSTGKSEYKLMSRKGTEGPQDEATLVLEGWNGKLKVTFRPPGAELQFDIAESKIVE